MSLVVSSGSIFYGTGSGISALSPGSSGQILSIESDLPTWVDAFTLQSGVAITGTLSIVNGTGSISSQTVEENYYYYFPKEKMCYVSYRVSFSGINFNDSTTTISIYQVEGNVLSIIPKPKNSGELFNFYTLGEGFSYNAIAGTYHRGHAFLDASNTEVSPRNPNSTNWSVGGWGTGSVTHTVSINGWYPTIS